MWRLHEVDLRFIQAQNFLQEHSKAVQGFWNKSGSLLIVTMTRAIYVTLNCKAQAYEKRLALVIQLILVENCVVDDFREAWWMFVNVEDMEVNSSGNYGKSN